MRSSFFLAAFCYLDRFADLLFAAEHLSTQLMHVSIRIRRIRVDSFSSASDSIRSRTKAICLLFFVLLSITIGIIPHLPTINKDNQRIWNLIWITTLYG